MIMLQAVLVLAMGCARSHLRTDVDGGAHDGGVTSDAGDAAAPPDGGPSCEPMDAESARPCGPAEDPAPRVVWDGTGCQIVAWCECAGTDCDRLFESESACLAVYGTCPVPVIAGERAPAP